MKIVRFRTETDGPRFGVVDGDEIVVLEGDPIFQGYETTGERIRPDAVQLLAPVIPRSKAIGIGRNYEAHVVERGDVVHPWPITFIKANTTVVGPHEPIVIPAGVANVQPEGELVIVIGKPAKNVAAADYADYVFGYTICNDVTSRQAQEEDGQWARAKGYDTFLPLGPAIVTELDWEGLQITTLLNGEEIQDGTTDMMIAGVPELIERLSSVWTLLPGDLILTGTPGGMRDIVPGDIVTITIPEIGTLANPIVAGK